MTDEVYVRANWERIEVCGRFVSMWPNANEFEEVCANFEGWAAAAKFTRERLEQIRQLGRQIEWCRAGLSDWYDPIYWHWDENEREEESVLRTRASNAREDVTGRLIVARLESALADLKRGMRTAAPKCTTRHSND